MARNELRFGILGPLEISAGFRSLPLGTPKQRAVLATLIIHRNRPVGIDSLIDAAWEQDRPEGSRATVYTYVSNLRRLVSTTGADSHSILASAPPGYRLAVADNQYDVARFISQRSAGLRAAAAGSFEQASDHLSAALAEWRGPVLDDLREFSFVTRLANSLVEDKIIAHTALAEAEIACGRADSVISELEELILEHPYHEALWRQLIAAYYCLGTSIRCPGRLPAIKDQPGRRPRRRPGTQGTHAIRASAAPTSTGHASRRPGCRRRYHQGPRTLSRHDRPFAARRNTRRRGAPVSTWPVAPSYRA